jgi:hypothetical protein
MRLENSLEVIFKLKRLPHNAEAQKVWDESWGEGTDYIVGNAILVKAEINKGW